VRVSTLAFEIGQGGAEATEIGERHLFQTEAHIRSIDATSISTRC
jgi:hypothetical protein